MDTKEIKIGGKGKTKVLKIGGCNPVTVQLTEKLWPGDQFITKFLRWLDKIKRSNLRRDNLLVDWRIVYGTIK